MSSTNPLRPGASAPPQTADKTWGRKYLMHRAAIIGDNAVVRAAIRDNYKCGWMSEPP